MKKFGVALVSLHLLKVLNTKCYMSCRWKCFLGKTQNPKKLARFCSKSVMLSYSFFVSIRVYSSEHFCVWLKSTFLMFNRVIFCLIIQNVRKVYFKFTIHMIMVYT